MRAARLSKTHAYEMYTIWELHACEMAYGRRTPMREMHAYEGYMPLREMHAYEGCTPIREMHGVRVDAS
jgi:hypothetical protein